ncbi:MAG TPA: FtsX-like permease family protein, partial [Gammaproteobacteria bacterium]|nr:FtsX-like permease family protein [Gammaproteobacteria bacterium]
PAEMDSGAAVVINRSAARHFWPGQSAIGRRLQAIGKSLTVVAVVEDAAAGGLIVADKHTPQLYFPYRSDKVPGMLGQPPEQVYIVRAKSDPAPVIAALRAATRAIDPEVAIRDITLTDTALASSIDGPRFNMALLTAFAVLAVVLAAVGLAAVTSYGVVERTHEIGIRMALGARQGNVLGLVVKQAMATAVAGTALGVLGALAATRLLSTLIYGVAPRDPGTFVGVSVLLLGVALAASLVAARRATRVDPMAALRAE